MSDWQPIETAPEGQDDILVACTFDDGSAQLHVACRWARGWGTAGYRSYQPLIDPAPTYWMPLPDPPTDREQNGSTENSEKTGSENG